MEQLLMEFGLKEGIFAVITIWLLFYVLQTSKERENKLYSFLDGMKGEFAKLVGSYEKLSNDVAEIREEMEATNKIKYGRRKEDEDEYIKRQ